MLQKCLTTTVFLRVETEVVEYITPEYVSKRTGKKVHAAFPEGAKDDVNYDGTVKAAAYLLNNQCCVSINKTREFLGGGFGWEAETVQWDDLRPF